MVSLETLSPKPHDLVVIAAYTAIACAIFGGGSLIRPFVQRLSEQRGFAFDGEEGARKFAHICSGLFIAALPYTGASYLAGVVIGAGIISVLLFLRTPTGQGPLDYLFNRRAGSVTFAACIVSMSLLCFDQPAIYAVSFIILSFADPAAAWAGMTFEQRPFLRKSRAGFLAHLGVTAAVLVAFFLAQGAVPWWIALGAATALAAVLSLIEGVSTRGLDNITVPLAASLGLNALLWLAQ